MHELREKVAGAMWKREAERAAPNVARHRTLDVFLNDLAEPEQARWLDLADAALSLVFDHLMEPSDAVWFATAPVLSGSTGYIEREDFIKAYQAMLTKAKEEAGL